ncbi:hypothetical protein HC723_11255 [Vibrio sp. S11_S32]|uniref:hypothetical protein n=1 Tax=Vibrio sp. S11_S32 TaxID=2720225 RepID=UPI00168135FA|nr:hypothetical protein [Vibrio sp. S11_S32]MBD1577007.1 hypothetical protein [Vibrio sp. S11_S32]
MKYRLPNLSLSNVKIATGLSVAILVSGCSTIGGDQVSIGSADEINQNITLKQDPLTRSADLQTASYWTKCDGKFDGAGYRYRTSVYANGHQQTQLYVRLKSSQGPYGINKAFDDDGEQYKVTVYQPENKSDSVVYENFALDISPQQLKAAAEGPLSLHFVGDKNRCDIVVEKPVSWVFDMNLDALLKQVEKLKAMQK